MAENIQPPPNPDFNPCGGGLFHCGKSFCIPESRVCDRAPDCPGTPAEDEKGCLELCQPPGYYPCGDGHCILGEQRCNGVADCKTGVDEGIMGGCGTFVRDLIIGVSVIFVIVSVCLAVYVIVKRRRNWRRMVNARTLATKGPEAINHEPTFKKTPPTNEKSTKQMGYYDDETLSVCSADDALLLDETKRKKKGVISQKT